MMFAVSKLIMMVIVTCEGSIRGPPAPGNSFTQPASQQYGPCDQCQWTSPSGAFYDLSHLCDRHYTIRMENPRGAKLTFGVCDVVACEASGDSMACIEVPANSPTTTGKTMQFSQMEPNVPAAGVRLTLVDGMICAVTKRPRKTVIDFECQPSVSRHSMEPTPTRAWEGEGSDICNYYVHFPTGYGCPDRPNKYKAFAPRITAVSGCVDSVPRQSTSDCHPGGGTELTIHGTDFLNGEQQPVRLDVQVNGVTCGQARVVNMWTVTCTLQPGTGEGHGLSLTLTYKKHTSSGGMGTPETALEEVFVTSSQATVSYKPLVDYRRHFDSFMDLGVGGLTKQIKELYQRAFASRSVPGSVLKQLGIEHAKGILLYGPPGSGKTLLARTIAKILKTEQVKMVNAPEIMSKYLGESEKNLRSYFEEAEKAWLELGEASDLYVIIIDEIDAICKPRGKSDSSAAAAAYDSVVNQLLTKMDGLRALHNVLVIGLTNRRELIDPALLRPGRFEIQIEIGLPDERGRWEIFYIHTKKMRDSGYMAADVDLEGLARNTSQYSGAEIAGLVRLAASLALDRKYANLSQDLPLVITQADFNVALKQVKPAYTQTERQVLQKFLPRGFIPCGQAHDRALAEMKQVVQLLAHSNENRLESILLYGPRGAGKSGLAAHLASIIKFTFIKFLTPTSLLRYNQEARTEILIDTFQDAHKADVSLVVLDDLHHLADVVSVANKVHASHMILKTLATLLADQPPDGSRLVVVGTLFCGGANPASLDGFWTGKVGLQDMFTTKIPVPNLNAAGALDLLDNMEIKKLGGRFFHLPPNFSISLRNMLKVTDCVEYHLKQASGQRSRTPQELMDSCLGMYPHREPLAFNL